MSDLLPEEGSQVMIRFHCATCAKPLRAPEAMAGKKGRCAQCGAVNRVPEVVSVDVKRAAAPSPFRDADAPVRGAIEKVVEMSGARFLSSPPPSGRLAEGGGDFFDQIAPRMGSVTDPLTTVERPVRERLDPRDYESAEDGAGDTYDLDEGDSRDAYVRRAVWAALFVGAVVGFFAGLLASRWVL